MRAVRQRRSVSSSAALLRLSRSAGRATHPHRLYADRRPARRLHLAGHAALHQLRYTAIAGRTYARAESSSSGRLSVRVHRMSADAARDRGPVNALPRRSNIRVPADDGWMNNGGARETSVTASDERPRRPPVVHQLSTAPKPALTCSDAWLSTGRALPYYDHRPRSPTSVGTFTYTLARSLSSSSYVMATRGRRQSDDSSTERQRRRFARRPHLPKEQRHHRSRLHVADSQQTPQNGRMPIHLV